MKRHKVNINSWNRFLTRNLEVAPEVMGQKHVFPFDGSTVSVKIPSIDQVDRGKGHDEVAFVGARSAVDHEPLEYKIHKVDVEVSIPITISILSEVLEQPPNAYDLISEKEQNKLNEVAKQHQTIAEKAFEYWIRITRWVCDDSRIGRDKVEDFRSGWSTSLKDMESDKEIWIQSVRLCIEGHKSVNHKEWQEIQSKLSNGLQPPIYVELKHDAEESIQLGDYRRSLVNMTMACETFIRFTVLQKLPEELNKELVVHIERANISLYIDKLFPEIIEEAANKRFKNLTKDIKGMFRIRNGLLHMGRDHGLDEKRCLRLLRVTQELLSIVST